MRGCEWDHDWCVPRGCCYLLTSVNQTWEKTKTQGHGGKPDKLLEDSLREILDLKFSSIYCGVMLKKVLFHYDTKNHKDHALNSEF